MAKSVGKTNANMKSMGRNLAKIKANGKKMPKGGKVAKS